MCVCWCRGPECADPIDMVQGSTVLNQLRAPLTTTTTTVSARGHLPNLSWYSGRCCVRCAFRRCIGVALSLPDPRPHSAHTPLHLCVQGAVGGSGVAGVQLGCEFSRGVRARGCWRLVCKQAGSRVAGRVGGCLLLCLHLAVVFHRLLR